MNISGPIESITLSGRKFAVNGDDAGNVVLQGRKNEVKFNGDGSKRIIKSMASGSTKNLNIQITHGNKDLEFVRNLQDKSDFFDVTLVYCDGTTYSGSMQFVDDITEDTQQGTASISLEGDLEMQS